MSSREKGIRRREEGETTSSQRMISAQGNQDECKKNHTKPEDESPTQGRNRKNDIDKEAKRMEDMRSKGGGRLKHCTVDGDVPLCLRRKLEDNKESSSSESKKYEEKGSGNGNREKMKNCVMNNMASGSKELQLHFTAGNDMHSKNREVTFIILQKNMRSMHSSEKIEELVTELEGYRWDTILLSETWRHEPAEIWETHHNHIFMGAGKYENKHGVGIMLNRRWRKRIVDTNYINERAIKTTIMVNRRRIDLMSVYFPHSKYADHHIEKMYKTIEKHMPNNKKCIPIIGGDFNAELGLGKGTECKSVGKYTLNESNKSGDWLKSWLMLNDYSALNTMFRKTPQKQTSFVSPKGKEKQIDYILTKRRYLRNVKDAGADDMIHMGSDHRCVMATFLIDMPERKNNVRRGNAKQEKTMCAEQEDEAKENNSEKSELEKRYQEIIVTIKKAAAKKRKEAHDTRIDVKNTAAAAGAESTLVENAKQESEGKSMKHSSNDDSKSNTAAASEAGRATVETVARESEGGSMKHSSKDDSKSNTAAASEAGRATVETVARESEGGSKKHSSNDEQRVTAAASMDKNALVDTVLPETEGGTTMCSSEAAIPRGGSAHPEHRRPDGWTSTPRGKNDDETGSQAFVTTGGEGAHDRNKPIGCSSSCDLRAGERLPKQRPLGDDHPESGQELHLAAQMFLQVVEAGSIVLQSSRDSSETRSKDKGKQEITHNVAMKNDESVDKDAEITRLIEERRKLPKEEKHRLKELSKKKKTVSEKKRG